jgi:hypothetical protein
MMYLRRILLFLVVLTGLTLAVPSIQRIQKIRAETARVKSVQAELLAKYNTIFKQEKTRTNDAILKDTVQYAFKYSELVGLESQVDTELAVFHVESRFDPKCTGDHNRSYGIGQTARRQEKCWRAFWLRRGVKLGPIDSLETQVAFSVAELAFCIKKAGGDVKDGVRRYNGAGPLARKYVVYVMRARRILFAHQYRLGETVTDLDVPEGRV